MDEVTTFTVPCLRPWPSGYGRSFRLPRREAAMLRHAIVVTSVKKLGHHFFREQFVRLFGVRQHHEIGHPDLFDP